MVHRPDLKTCARTKTESPSPTCFTPKPTPSPVARIGNSSEGSTLYITASPCLECSKLIIQAGIKRVVYNDLYRIQDGLEILRRAGVECTHIAEID